MGRVESQRSHYPDRYQGKKELFLTATPIRNKPDELIPLLRGVGVNIPRDREAFNKFFIEEKKTKAKFLPRVFLGVQPSVTKSGKNLGVLQKALKGKVDYQPSSDKDFPSSTEEVVRVEMSKDQYKAYKATMKGNPSLTYKIKRGLPPSKQESRNLNSFLSASRQISNTPRQFDLRSKPSDATKIETMASEIKKHLASDKNYKGVSYSNYIGSGIEPLSKRLTKANVPHASFTGRLTPKEKKRIIEDYNAGKVKHLLVSGAGSEGLDLKGTKLLQVMEPHWNDPKIEQVKGRAIRIGSHAHLPKGERKVKIQRFLSTPRKEGIIFKKRPKGTDEYLSEMSKRKKALNQQFLRVLQETD